MKLSDVCLCVWYLSMYQIFYLVTYTVHIFFLIIYPQQSVSCVAVMQHFQPNTSEFDLAHFLGLGSSFL